MAVVGPFFAAAILNQNELRLREIIHLYGGSSFGREEDGQSLPQRPKEIP
jgi:hypothetical protein